LGFSRIQKMGVIEKRSERHQILALVQPRLNGDMVGGATLQAVVPAGPPQVARPLRAWVLVACIVAPRFDFAGFELAPPD